MQMHFLGPVLRLFYVGYQRSIMGSLWGNSSSIRALDIFSLLSSFFIPSLSAIESIRSFNPQFPCTRTRMYCPCRPSIVGLGITASTFRKQLVHVAYAPQRPVILARWVVVAVLHLAEQKSMQSLSRAVPLAGKVGQGVMLWVWVMTNTSILWDRTLDKAMCKWKKVSRDTMHISWDDIALDLLQFQEQR